MSTNSKITRRGFWAAAAAFAAALGLAKPAEASINYSGVSVRAKELAHPTDADGTVHSDKYVNCRGCKRLVAGATVQVVDPTTGEVNGAVFEANTATGGLGIYLRSADGSRALSARRDLGFPEGGLLRTTIWRDFDLRCRSCGHIIGSYRLGSYRNPRV